MFSRTTTVLAAASLLLTAGGIAYAAIPSADGTVNACYATSSSTDSAPKKGGGSVAAYTKGDIRVVGEGEACRSYETAISWNQQGVPGEPGPSGPAGPAGPTANVEELEAEVADLRYKLDAIFDPVLEIYVPGGQFFDFTVTGAGLKPGTQVTTGDLILGPDEPEGFTESLGVVGPDGTFSGVKSNVWCGHPGVRIRATSLLGDPVSVTRLFGC